MHSGVLWPALNRCKKAKLLRGTSLAPLKRSYDRELSVRQKNISGHFSNRNISTAVLDKDFNTLSLLPYKINFFFKHRKLQEVTVFLQVIQDQRAKEENKQIAVKFTFSSVISLTVKFLLDSSPEFYQPRRIFS